MTRGEAVPLDMSRFVSIEEGTRLVAEARSRLGQVASGLRPDGPGAPILMRTVGAAAVVARARALHEGAVRETLARNPPSALTLIRALVETTAAASYVLIREPDYVELLINSAEAIGARAPRRRSMQYLIDKAVEDGHPGIGQLFAQLSDVAHFGAGAAILPMRTSSAGGKAWLGFSATPEWQSESHLLNALAMIEEQTLVIAGLVEQYIERHIAPLLADPDRADREGQIFGWASEIPPDEPPLSGES